MADRFARGTRTWAKDAPRSRAHTPTPREHPSRWMLEYAMFCLGSGMALAGGLELAYRLGKCHRDFQDIVIPRTKTRRSIVSG